ncbi:MAG: hypothetical protein P0S94_01305 [Simkaniaceae bacterium]|nr:hypothetical protein [Simkaniaceae bacterium]
MQKVVVIGLPGSGKSTFAIELGKRLNIQVYHLDAYMFDANGVKKNRDEIISHEKRFVNDQKWIIEGCSFSTLETRFSVATDVFYFQLPRLVCLWRIFKRCLIFNKSLKETGCTRIVNWRLVKYIWTFEKKKMGIIENLRNKYLHVNFFTFNSAKKARHFLINL